MTEIALSSFDFHMPAKLLFGAGRIAELAHIVRAYGTNALLVSTKGFERRGTLERVRSILSDGGITVNTFLDVESDPSIETVNKAVSEARRAGVDVFIGLGGGSAMDTAKAAAIALRHPEPIWEYTTVGSIGKEGIRSAIPVVVVPTTSGTGSETTPFAVIRNRQTKVKDTLVSPHIFPKAAIVDYELLTTMPPALTASTGLDTFAQAMESYLSNKTNAMLDAISLGCMKLVVDNLHRSYANGDDLKAREGMAMASALSGMAISHTGCSAPHAIAHALGGHFGVPHGVAVSVVTPYVLEYNLPASVERYCVLAGLFGVDRDGKDDETYASELIGTYREFAGKLGIPAKLSDVGVQPSAIDVLVKDTLSNVSLTKNPRKFDRQSLHDLIERAL